MKKQMISFLKEDKGQGMVEYGLIIALIAIAVIAAITFLGENLTDIFNKINTELENAEPVQ